MTNKTIVEVIQSRYERDDRIPHPAEIAVAEHDGTVTLRGTVRSLHQMRAAGEIAQRVQGVTRVDNELIVDPRDRWRDAELRGAALQALMANDAVPKERIDVRVTDGWLTLKGETRHQEQSNAAFETVSQVEGIGGITNEIKVITAGIP